MFVICALGILVIWMIKKANRKVQHYLDLRESQIKTILEKENSYFDAENGMGVFWNMGRCGAWISVKKAPRVFKVRKNSHGVAPVVALPKEVSATSNSENSSESGEADGNRDPFHQ